MRIELYKSTDFKAKRKVVLRTLYLGLYTISCQ